MKPASITHKAWRAKNPDKVKQYAKTAYLKHKEDHKQRVQEWRKNNPEKVAEYLKKYRSSHTEQMNAANREWKKDHPEYNKEYFQKHKQERVLLNQLEIEAMENKLKKYERGNPPYFYMSNDVKMYWTPKPITRKLGMIYCKVVMQHITVCNVPSCTHHPCKIEK